MIIVGYDLTSYLKDTIVDAATLCSIHDFLKQNDIYLYNPNFKKSILGHKISSNQIELNNEWIITLKRYNQIRKGLIYLEDLKIIPNDTHKTETQKIFFIEE